MADPLSIASGTLAVITAAQKTATSIYKFIRDCREARTDLSKITGELSELTVILELIRDDNATATGDYLPNALQAQVQAMLASCTTAVQQIECTLAKCRGKPGPLRWTLLEKDKVAASRSSLEAFKSGLSLALETVNLSMTREIYNKTDMIQDSNAEIKRTTKQILDEIYKLRDQLPPGFPPDQESHRLEQWLDNLTHYAETIITAEELEGVSDVANPLEQVEGQEESVDGAGSSPIALVRTTDIEKESKDGVLRRRPQSTHVQGTGTQQSQIPCYIVASRLCNSPVVASAHCAALNMWATLHQDAFLRLWLPERKKPVLSLTVFFASPHYPRLRAEALVEFCPARPELILIQVRHSRVEVWDWQRRHRISLAEAMVTSYKVDWVKFVLGSTLIYATDSHGCMMIVNLDDPLISQKISLSRLATRLKTSLTQRELKKDLNL